MLAIVAIVFVFSLSIDFNYYKSSLFRSERSTLVSILERARSRAMNNLYESSHGVCYIVPNYIIFRGDTCVDGALTNELIAASANISITGLSDTSIVVFKRLSGRTVPKDITLTENGRTNIISINYEGSINW